MSVRRVSPAEASALMSQEGYAYLDVRSVPEFEAGHPEGAYNIPLMHARGGVMSPNPRFLAECEKAFPKDARLVVGCKAGSRSLQAASLLIAAGFTSVVDQRAGFDGGGEPGWRLAGLPVAREAAPGRSYGALTGNQP